MSIDTDTDTYPRPREMCTKWLGTEDYVKIRNLFKVDGNQTWTKRNRTMSFHRRAQRHLQGSKAQISQAQGSSILRL